MAGLVRATARSVILLILVWLLGPPARAAAGEVVLECQLIKDVDGRSRGERASVRLPAMTVRQARGLEELCDLEVSVHLHLRGDIDSEAADAFVAVADLILSDPRRRALIERLRMGISVHANSSGGDLDAALRIGEKVRALSARVWVTAPAACRSACVFILAAGVRRLAYGEVAVHRPYFRSMRPGLSQADAAALVRRTDDKLRDYLRRMNVPEALLDRMRTVPPEQMQRLGEAELERYMLHGDDPAHNERSIALQAARHGVNSAEYRRRAALAQRICPSVLALSDAHWRCRDAMLYALTEETYESRNADAEAKCLDPALQTGVPPTVAAWDAYDDCVRRVMLR